MLRPFRPFRAGGYSHARGQISAEPDQQMVSAAENGILLMNKRPGAEQLRSHNGRDGRIAAKTNDHRWTQPPKNSDRLPNALRKTE